MDYETTEFQATPIAPGTKSIITLKASRLYTGL